MAVGQEYWCDDCEKRTSMLCEQCELCRDCCQCRGLFDADELGLDPEEDDKRA